MKRILLSLTILLSATISFAQNGLENIIVERYYISDANDTTMNSTGGVLPIGSVTYRIFADMLPGYKFQAIYGVNTLGGAHEFRIATTTLFFNNEDRGSTSPTYTKPQARDNTVMLDSWLSAGAACAGNFGILKTEDDGASTNINNDGVLQNNNPDAGIPLTLQDGFIAVSGRSPEMLTPVGITNEIAVFDNQNNGTNGPVFSTWNGSSASLYGSVGPDSTTNKVLIAQITTDGVLSFELNLQLGTPTLGVEHYVAQNPVASEYQRASLSYTSPIPTNVHYQHGSSPGIVVYPNPSHGKTNLQIVGAGKNNNAYTIYDITGKPIMHKELGMIDAKHWEQLDLSALANGLYFVEFMADGVKTTKKIIKN